MPHIKMAASASGPRILIVRLGAMGDVIHTLPAVASLKHSLPHSRLTWVIHPRWIPLLEGNPYIDEILPFDRRAVSGIRDAWRNLRAQRFDFAVDFQGLIQSALVSAVARPERIYGFHRSQTREPLATLFYSHTTETRAAHIVDKNLELAAASGASSLLRAFPLPQGIPEGDLPAKFVLASPLAGWGSKQWPLENYAALARKIEQSCGLPLVVNGPPQAEPILRRIPGAIVHRSGLSGLIDATRRATAIVGVDSGPLHLAAALGRPGVAIFGPTDPARNGPYGGTIRVLRASDVVTSYKRRPDSDASMFAVSPEAVFRELALAGCPA